MEDTWLDHLFCFWFDRGQWQLITIRANFFISLALLKLKQFFSIFISLNKLLIDASSISIKNCNCSDENSFKPKKLNFSSPPYLQCIKILPLCSNSKKFYMECSRTEKWKAELHSRSINVLILCEWYSLDAML